MDLLTLIVYSLGAGLRIMHRSIRIETLRSVHVEEAAHLLSHEFFKREPLCNALRIQEKDLLPFFRGQVEHVARQGLGVVALAADGKVIGAATIEDHLDPFVPNPATVTEELASIGALLDTLTLPDDLCPTRRNEVFHCGLAAVESRHRHAPVLMMMFLGGFKNLRARGFVRGYMKASNPKVGAMLRKLEKRYLRNRFTAHAEVRPATFSHRGRNPFLGYSSSIVLYSWPIL